MMGWFSLSMPAKSGTWLTKGRFTTSMSCVGVGFQIRYLATCHACALGAAIHQRLTSA